MDCGSDGISLVAAEIVHDHDVAGFEAGNEYLLDVEQEALAIDGTVEDTRRCHVIAAQGGQECERFPVAMGDAAFQSLSPS